MRLARLSLGAMALFFILGFTGCGNPSTPAGYVGYVKRGVLLFGKESFHSMQTGPTSTGLGWMLSVTNISITPYTYHEPMEVLSRDNLKVKFQVHIVWRVSPEHEKAKVFVEKFTTLRGDSTDPDHVVRIAYDNFLKEPLRTAARDEIQGLETLHIKEVIVPTGKAIENKLKIWTQNSPFDILSIVVGDIQYPEEVETAVAKKMAATQLLEQKATEIEIERREKEKRIVQAEGIAKAMEIIQVKLTSQYLQHEAIEAQKAMVGSLNHTTVYIPVGNMGVPMVGTFDVSRRKE